MENGPDSVSNIHRRWSLTRINFSSYKISLVISIITSFIIIIFFDHFYLTLNLIQIVVFTITGISFLVFSYFLDLYLLRKTPVNKISKILHVSAFSNLLWLLILILGYLAFIIFQKEIPPKEYLLEGMMLAIGLRIGIFNSVFGANLLQAIKTAVIQPIVFLFLIIPPSIVIEFFFDVAAISFGLILIGLGIGWTILADRAGRPNLQSTFALLQAFLSAWTENKVENIEKLLLAKSKDELVYTHIIKFINKQHHNLYWVLPNIHPGPFKEIGGSSLPYQIYNHFSQKAVVFHTASDHSLNIPSKGEVIKYLQSLSSTKKRLDYGSTCSLPIQIKNKKATATGIIFDNTPIIILSFAPSGMEDIPEEISKELKAYSKNEGFKRLFIIDSHNAMGKKIGKSENDDLLIAGKKCLNILKGSPQYGFKIGISNTNEINNHVVFGEDIGKSGLSIILIDVNKDANNKSNNNRKDNNNNQYVIGWADSNNMKNGLREYILQHLEQKGIRMLEICSSDTHENSGFRTSEGYYPFGHITKFETIADHYYNLIELACKKLELYVYEILSVESTVKVMGKNQFMDYSNALDKAMDLTKKCLIITFGVILLMLIVTN